MDNIDCSINLDIYYPSNETKPGFVAITVLKPKHPNQQG